MNQVGMLVENFELNPNTWTCYAFKYILTEHKSTDRLVHKDAQREMEVLLERCVGEVFMHSTIWVYSCLEVFLLFCTVKCIRGIVEIYIANQLQW